MGIFVDIFFLVAFIVTFWALILRAKDEINVEIFTLTIFGVIVSFPLLTQFTKLCNWMLSLFGETTTYDFDYMIYPVAFLLLLLGPLKHYGRKWEEKEAYKKKGKG